MILYFLDNLAICRIGNLQIFKLLLHGSELILAQQSIAAEGDQHNLFLRFFIHTTFADFVVCHSFR